jgi:parvulin-like peptidyl-prolyl isomerase
MTFRAKPVAKKAPKHSWESRDRRNFYLNLGFGLVIVSAVAILLIAVGVTYYGDNLAPVGSVNGQAISKAELRDRAKIESWRLDEAQRRIRTLTVAGRLTEAQANVQEQIIAQQQQQLPAITLERLIDNKLQAGLAAEQGVTVTDADIDERLKVEATTPASRHGWVIEVAPETSAGAGEPTAAQITDAKAKAEAALKELQGGKAWEDVAKSVSTDASTAPQGGDLGWIQADDSQADPDFVAALYAAAQDTPTAVIEGADGIFRIGRVTEIANESVDGAYTDKLVNDGIDLAQYRQVVRGDVIRQKLEDAIVADALKPGPQRDTSEIYLAQTTVDLPADAVKVRHILFSPKDDPAAAQAGDIPESDPSWEQAKADAFTAFAKLQQDPTQFDAIARAESDEESAKGPTGTGGVLSSYVTADGNYVESFSGPILAAKAKDGQILPPIKTEFGYHVVQVLNHKPTMEDIKRRLDAGEDFAQLARDLSDAPEASQGGNLGWISKSQLQPELTAAIFATAVGKVSDVVTVKDDGQYLFKVRAEEERAPDTRQEDAIRSRAWSDWYDPKKAAAKIERDDSITGSGVGL